MPRVSPIKIFPPPHPSLGKGRQCLQCGHVQSKYNISLVRKELLKILRSVVEDVAILPDRLMKV